MHGRHKLDRQSAQSCTVSSYPTAAANSRRTNGESWQASLRSQNAVSSSRRGSCLSEGMDMLKNDNPARPSHHATRRSKEPTSEPFGREGCRRHTAPHSKTNESRDLLRSTAISCLSSRPFVIPCHVWRRALDMEEIDVASCPRMHDNKITV